MINHNTEEGVIKKAIFENLLVVTMGILVLYVIIYQLFLLKINELIIWGAEIGIVTYNLSLSIIASGIFYYMVVYIPEKRKKNKVRQVINMRFEQIESNGIITYGDIKRFSAFENTPNEFPQEINQFKNICQDMLLTSQPPHYFAGSAMVPLNNWFEYFKYNFRYDDKNLEELYKYSSYLEPETMQLMHDLSSHTLRKVINQYHSEYTTHEYATKFSSLSHILHDYIQTSLKFKQDSWI